MRYSVRQLVIGALAVLALVSSAHAQRFADNVGPLRIELKEDGAWQAEARSGWTLLRNRTDPGSIRLFYAEQDPLGGGMRSVRANVLVRGAGSVPSYAGLLFGRRDANNFMGFLIRSDGAVVWMRQAPGSTDFRPAEGVRAKMDGTDILELRETPGKIQMVLNGSIAMTAENPDGFPPSFGLVAVGTGRFGFDAFSIRQETSAPERREPERREPERRTEPPEVTAEQVHRTQVLLGTTLGVLFHELGHALIGETKLPATGPEEDVADGFSAFVLASMVTEAEDPTTANFLAGIVRYKALLWYYSAQAKKRAGVEESWQSEHAPDIRRFRNVFCIVYGSDPARYEDLALRFELQLPTRQRCLQEYEKRYAAWEALLRTVSRKSPDEPAARHPADAPGGKINLRIQQPTGGLAAEVHQLINGPDAIMAEIMKFLEQAIVWPQDVTVEFRHCPGMAPNAWYDPNAHSVTMCYEVIDFFSKFIFDGEKRDGPIERTSGPQVDPTDYLIGTWTAKLQGANGQVVNISYIFDRSGAYLSLIEAGSQRIRTEGSWTASKGDGGLISLDLNPTKTEPAQICDPNGNCQPNRPQRETVALKIRTQTVFHSSGLDFTKTP